MCNTPFDRRRVYKVNHKIYDPSGKLLGSAGFYGSSFKEGELTEPEDDERKSAVLLTAALVGTVVAFLVIAMNSSNNY